MIQETVNPFQSPFLSVADCRCGFGWLGLLGVSPLAFAYLLSHRPGVLCREGSQVSSLKTKSDGPWKYAITKGNYNFNQPFLGVIFSSYIGPCGCWRKHLTSILGTSHDGNLWCWWVWADDSCQLGRCLSYWFSPRMNKGSFKNSVFDFSPRRPFLGGKAWSWPQSCCHCTTRHPAAKVSRFIQMGFASSMWWQAHKDSKVLDILSIFDIGISAWNSHWMGTRVSV